MKQTLSRILRPSLRAGQNVLSGFPHSGAPASFVERVKPQQSSHAFHTTPPVLAATDRGEEKFIAGIRIAPRHTEHWDEAVRYVEENTFSSTRAILDLLSNTNDIIPQFNGFNEELAGRLVALEEVGKEKTIYPLSSVEEVRNIDAVVFLGLDTADNEKGIISGIQGFNKLLSCKDKQDSEVKENKIAAFYPKEQRDRRYKDGLVYFANENFVPAWAEVFVAQYIFPRLVDENGQLLHLEKIKPLVMLGYSLGAREAIMVENATIDLLQNMFGKADKEIAPYMNKFLRFGIGHAVNWEYPVRPITSYAISITAVKDIGIRRPQSFMNGAFGDGECFKQKLTMRHHATIHGDSPQEFLGILRVMPSFIERNGEKRLNRLGHGFSHYLVAVEQDCQVLVEILRNFMAAKAIDRQIMDLARDSSEFTPRQQMTEKARGELLVAWSDHLSIQDGLEAQKRSILSPNVCNSSKKWKEIFAQNDKMLSPEDLSSPWRKRVASNNEEKKGSQL